MAINHKAVASARKEKNGIQSDSNEILTLMPGYGQNSGSCIKESGRSLIMKTIEADRELQAHIKLKNQHNEEELKAFFELDT